MNKKGFTLLEVMISVVLVSIVLTSMLATLVKLKDAYEIIYEDTDALIFSSSLARIINNDFEQNGGIRYIDCNYNGDVCDVTLNSDEKRQIEIYNVQVGNSVSDYLTEFSDTDISKVFKVNVKANGSKEYENIDKDTLINKGKNIYCEATVNGNKRELRAMCSQSADGSLTCDCMKQRVSTTFRYSNTTDGTKKNIYLKTLTLEKTIDIGDKNNPGTYKVNTKGYNFGKMSYTNLMFDSSNKKTNSNKPYKNNISTITIELNDGVDTLDSSYNVLLSSTSSFSPDNIQIGNMLCFVLDNFGTINSVPDTAGKIKSVNQKIDTFCVKYGAGFYVEKGGNYSKVTKLNTSPQGEAKELPDLMHLPVDKGNAYVFNGYYYTLPDDSKMAVIDAEGNILISTTNFDTSGLTLTADWTQK